MNNNRNWREEIALIGKDLFSLREMLRLGFITPSEVEQHEASLAEVSHLIDEHRELESELRSKTVKLSKMKSMESILAEVRSKRIARIKALREIRKSEKKHLDIEQAINLRERKLSTPYFLGKGVSEKLTFDEPDTAKLQQFGLPILKNMEDLASLLGMPREDLLWLSYHSTAAKVDHYLRFEIPKRSGGLRSISSPKSKMREAQFAIRKEILSKLQPSAQAMAFRPGKSIVDNAKAHVGSGVIVRIDLKDFFPSITFPRVRGFFMWLGYNPGIATILALLTTDVHRVRVEAASGVRYVARGSRGLPQGACTSPDLANLISKKLDARIQGLANHKGGWIYTRYADDLVFSHQDSNADAFGIAKAAAAIVEQEGFDVNQKKTSIRRKSGRMMVTGLAVHSDRVRLSKNDIKRIRAFFHRCDTAGFEQVSTEIDQDAKSVAKGYLAYMHMVSPDIALKYREKYTWLN